VTDFRKPRADRWDAALSEAQRWAIYERSRRFPWPDMTTWIEEEHHITVSRNAYYRWQREMRTEESAHRIETALSVKENVRREMDAVGDMDQELEFAWEQLAMESALKGDEEAGMRYLAMSMKLRESALERAKLQIKKDAEARSSESLRLEREKFEDQKCRNAEAKAALAGVAGAARAGGVDEATIAEIERAAKLL
jgi:hypothetical protein